MKTEDTSAVRVVFTDAGIDDAFALIFLGHFLRGGADYIVCGGGNVPADHVANNCAFLRELFEWESQLYAGSNPPFQSSCDAADVHGQWGLAGRRLPPVNLPALDGLREVLQGSTRPIDILALGPSNDAAETLGWPGIQDRVSELVIMGGVFEVEGNITPHAEFNVYMDPTAAECVMKSGCRSVWVPLDATRAHLYTENELLSGLPAGPRAALMREMYEYCAAAHRRLDCGDGVFMHDVLAAAVWLDLVDARLRSTRVRRVGADGDERGKIHHGPEDGGGSEVRYVTRLDHDGFLRQWKDVSAGME